MHIGDSPHPEWDEMYSAGFPIARIADLVGVGVKTVQRHLEGRRPADPDLPIGGVGRIREPSVIWLRRLDQLRDFIAKHGRYPTNHGTEEAEVSLYGWVIAQRHAFVTQTLGWSKARELGVLGDWVTTDMNRTLDEHWRQRLGEVADFIAENGRLPRNRTAKSELERVLGIWLQSQNQDILHERIMQWRREALHETLPKGWRKPKQVSEPRTDAATTEEK